ncbi:MAG: two-component hybrid sensor and regulator [Deltaproteobacteria bacterium]|nr:two-component hybrid sensor and regulator [Deltaproteobacteria bacterium]
MKKARKAATAGAVHAPAVNDARWHALLNAVRDAIVSIDDAGRITLFNPTAERMFGYRAEEILGRSIELLMPPPYRERHAQHVREYRETGNPKAIGRIRKLHALRKNGEVFPIELSLSEIRADNQLAYSAVIRDITEREATEEALRRERDFAERLLETAQVIVLVLDIDGRLVRFNRQMERISGYRLDAVRGADWVSTFVPPREQQRMREAFAVSANDVSTQAHVGTVITKNGTERLIEWYANSLKDHDGNVFGMLAIGQDVTERQRAERRLVSQYAVTRVLAGSVSLQEATAAVLQSLCEATGWEFGELWCLDRELDSLTWRGAWHTPTLDTTELEAASRGMHLTAGQGLPGRAFASGRPAWVGDVTTLLQSVRAPIAAKLGLRSAFAFPLRARGMVIGVITFYCRDNRPPDNELLQMLDAVGSQIGDFIERKRAEEDLMRMSKAIESTSDGVCMADLNKRSIYHNQAFANLFGYNRQTLNAAGGPPALFANAATAAKVFGTLEKGRSWSGEVDMKSADGRLIPALLRADRIVDETGILVGFIGTCTDMTERRRAEAELQDLQKRSLQRERLADIGAITAKLVHDIGNPLAGLSMQAQLVLRRVRLNETGDSLLRPAEKIVSEVHRLEGLINEFREFSREQRLHRQAIDIPRFLREVVDLWQPVARPHAITISLESPIDVPTIQADPDKLRRVFDNLVKNAVEAIEPGPGQVTIHVALPIPGKLRISVEDSGPGIPESVDVFHLFETTKSQGSGLGLTIAREIVLAHGGSIAFVPRQPHGTIFHVDLPVDRPIV